MRSKGHVRESQSLMNQMLRMALAGNDPAETLSALCGIAKRNPDEHWADWFHTIADDADKLADKIEAIKDDGKKNGLTNQEIDGHVRHRRDAAKPSLAVRKSLAAAMDSYPLETTLRFNPKTCKIMQTDKHPKAIPSERLVAFKLSIAIRDKHWQSFRHCKEPKCGTLFFDHMKRGRKPQRYCCLKHGASHRARLRRGNP